MRIATGMTLLLLLTAAGCGDDDQDSGLLSLTAMRSLGLENQPLGSLTIPLSLSCVKR